MSAISVEILRQDDAVERLRDEWRDLFAESKCSPFLSWEWMSAWQRSFGTASELFIVKVYRDDRLIGVMPLRKVRKKLLAIGLTRLGFIGEDIGGADYLDAIARPEDRSEVIAAVIRSLSSEGFDLICLKDLSSTSAVMSFLRGSNNASNALKVSERASYVCPQIDLAKGWDDVLKQSRRASNFRRRLKQLERREGFEYRSVTSANGVVAAFERFLLLHKKRWRAGGSELSGRPELEAFQRAVVVNMAHTGLLRFDELWTGGECRASAYGFDDGHTFYYYNTGFDPDWANHSVGLVLTGLSIRAAVERGIATYDFLRGDEGYKFDWANRTQEMVNITLARDTVAAKLAVGMSDAGIRGRSLAKTLLPSGAVEAVKKWRWAFRAKYPMYGQ